MKALWITPKFPFPPDDGAKRANTALIRSMTEAGVQVDLYSIVPPEGGHIHGCVEDKAEAEKWGIHRSVRVYSPAPANESIGKISYYLRALIKSPMTPLTFYRYQLNELAEEIQSSVEAGKYDFILFDGLHTTMSWILSPISTSSSTVFVHRSHNVESQLWYTAGREAKNPLKSLFYKFQGDLVSRLEIQVIARSDINAFISREDMELSSSKGDGRQNHLVVPIGFDFSEPAPMNSEGEQIKLLYVGKLDWAPNQDGLKWFLQEVWPQVIAKRKSIHLDIVGSGDKSWLDEFGHLTQMTVHGRVPEVDPFYNSCHGTIVPIFFGSGTRIKFVESCRFARPCISSPMAAQGSGLGKDKYFECFDREAWVELLCGLSPKECVERGKAAFDFVREHYEMNRVAKKLLDRIMLVQGEKKKNS